MIRSLITILQNCVNLDYICVLVFGLFWGDLVNKLCMPCKHTGNCMFTAGTLSHSVSDGYGV